MKLNMQVKATLESGEVIEVVGTTADMMRCELHAHREKWPLGGMQTAPFLTMAFVGWSAARRTEKTQLKWAQWFEQLADLEGDPGDAEEEPAGPTQGP